MVCLGNLVAGSGAGGEVPVDGGAEGVHHPAVHHAGGKRRVLTTINSKVSKRSVGATQTYTDLM